MNANPFNRKFTEQIKETCKQDGEYKFSVTVQVYSKQIYLDDMQLVLIAEHKNIISDESFEIGNIEEWKQIKEKI